MMYYTTVYSELTDIFALRGVVGVVFLSEKLSLPLPLPSCPDSFVQEHKHCGSDVTCFQDLLINVTSRWTGTSEF